MTGARFQKRNSAERWRAVSEKVRSPLGAMRSRVLMSEQNLPAPPYGYEVVKFRTNFANKANVVETVTLERADDGWKVAGGDEGGGGAGAPGGHSGRGDWRGGRWGREGG